MEILINKLFELNILQSISVVSVVWVALSWAKLLIKEDNKLYKYLCLKCVSFWTALILTQSIPTAALAALLAMIVDIVEQNKIIKL